MGTLDRYVLRKLLRTLIPALGGLCFLFFLGATWRLLRDEDLSLQQVAGSLPWVLPFLIPYLLPLAWLATLALVYGRMVADQEVLAFVALGVPQRALAKPALLLGALLSLLTVWLTATVVPYCYQKRKAAAQAVFAQLFTLGEGEHLSRVFPRQGFDLYVRRHSPEGLEGIVLHFDLSERDDDPSARSPVQVSAERGAFKEQPGGDLGLELTNVSATAQIDQGRSFALSQQGQETKELERIPEPAPPVRLHLERWVQGVGTGGRRRLKPMDYGSADLRRQLDEEEERQLVSAVAGGFVAARQGRGGRALELKIELYVRGATASAPLVLTALAIPLVLLVGSRNALIPFALAILAGCLGYFVPLLASMSLADTSGVPELVGLGPLVPLLLGGGLAWLVARR